MFSGVLLFFSSIFRPFLIIFFTTLGGAPQKKLGRGWVKKIQSSSVSRSRKPGVYREHYGHSTYGRTEKLVSNIGLYL